MSKKKKIEIPEGLDIKPEDYFSQNEFISKSRGKLSDQGVCNGIIMKRAIEHIDLDRPTSLTQFNKNIINDFENFIKTTNLYQSCLQTAETQDAKEVSASSADVFDGKFIENLPDNLKKSNIIGFSLMGVDDGHIISISIARDKNNDVFGYTIFDPNYGEINCNNCGTKERNTNKFNQQLINLCKFYQTNIYQQDIPLVYLVSDVESVIRTAGLSKSRPLAADKTREVKEGGEHIIRPILSEYSYEEKNKLLDYHMKQHNRASQRNDSQEITSHLQDIEHLVISGVNPNILEGDLIDKYKTKAFTGTFLSKNFKKAIDSRNFEEVKDLIKFIGKDNIRNLQIDYFIRDDKGENLSIKTSPVLYAYYGGNIIESIELLKEGFSLTEDELKAVPFSKTMLKLSKDVNARLNNGKSILGEFIKNASSAKVIEYLLKDPNVDVNARCIQGNSLLHIAVQAGKVDIVKKLIQKNADITLVNQEGKRAMDYANYNGNQDILALLNHAAKPKFPIFSSRVRPIASQENVNINVMQEEIASGGAALLGIRIPDNVALGMSAVTQSSRAIDSAPFTEITHASKRRKYR